VEELDAAFLAAIQKSNYLDVYEHHSTEVQRNPRLSAFYLRVQLIQMGRLQPTAETNHRLSPIGIIFNPQCHL
jgi:hypothetical protein